MVGVGEATLCAADALMTGAPHPAYVTQGHDG
jgi:hypothetical protein